MGEADRGKDNRGAEAIGGDGKRAMLRGTCEFLADERARNAKYVSLHVGQSQET